VDILLNTALERQIYDLVTPSLMRMGYEVVRVKLMEDGGRHILQIMLDCTDGRQVTVEDCEKASKQLSALLDVEDPIEHHYDLEVSSPGIDRPLTRLKDFERFKNLEVKIETRVPVNGQKRFRGKLKGVRNGDQIVVVPNLVSLADTAGKEEEVEIPFSAVFKAKLILNDELLEHHS
jgi:ribosome maturation factor RimP